MSKAKLTFHKALDLLRRNGARMIQTNINGDRAEYWMYPSGIRVEPSLAAKLKLHPQVKPGSDGIWPGHDQTWRIVGEREQRRTDQRLYLEQCRQREEQWNFEYRQQQMARREAAERERLAVAQQERHRERLAQQQRTKEEIRDRELRDLRLKVTKQDWWQQSVELAARNAEAQQRLAARLALIDDWAPPRLPEPVVVVVDPEPEEEDRRWFRHR